MTEGKHYRTSLSLSLRTTHRLIDCTIKPQGIIQTSTTLYMLKQKDNILVQRKKTFKSTAVVEELQINLFRSIYWKSY